VLIFVTHLKVGKDGRVDLAHALTHSHLPAETRNGPETAIKEPAGNAQRERGSYRTTRAWRVQICPHRRPGIMNEAEFSLQKARLLGS